MGDEKDYFDKMFSLVEKSFTSNEKIKEAQAKIESKILVLQILFAVVTFILGRNDPILSILVSMFVK